MEGLGHLGTPQYATQQIIDILLSLLQLQVCWKDRCNAFVRGGIVTVLKHVYEIVSIRPIWLSVCEAHVEILPRKSFDYEV